MTIAYNLLPILFFFAMVYWAKARYSKAKSLKSIGYPLVVLLIVLFFYFQVQPSYMPKGEIKRSSVPALEQEKQEIKDLTPKPMPADKRDEEREKRYREKLPFVE